ncbi:unnamed protein product [Acanthoscelides obtectus]|uniref:C2H2-type domain-containing protein n=1 Tax=Acanthoscelides obtectus TaxID=200917 RepID=A0A9P0PZX0_ACAOB|nr:unnamed protein product [Acanthoscelides obtectus]CAK1664859.1 Zinc finger protein 710 [Acanthoscelides obtectus]
MSDQNEKMEPENLLTVKEFESAQMAHELIKSAEEEVSEIQKAIKEENDLDSKEFEVTPVFIKNENGQLIDTNAIDTVWDRFYNGCDTIVNVDPTAMRFEGTGEGVLKMQDEKIELQKHEHNKYKVAESCDPLIIKNENDEYKFTDADTENMSTSTGNDDFTKPWTKSEAVEELKLENCLDTEACTETSEECINKIEKHPKARGSHKPYVCIHCNETFRRKRSLDGHIFKKHPDFAASISSKMHLCAHCAYGTTKKDHLVSHMLKHPGTGASKPNVCIQCNRSFMSKINLGDHIINKHPKHIASVSSKIHECTDCTYKTTFKIRMARHMSKHPDAKSSYTLKKCVHCDAKFSTKILLGNHIINKHPDFIGSVFSKIHECTHCTYKTTIKGNLAIHMLKHPDAKSSYKLNECIHCNRTFISKKSLNDHIIKKHPEYIASVTSKIHECKYCIFKTIFKDRLARHIWQQHPGAEGGCQLETCIHCNRTFSSKINLHDHIIRDHPGYITTVSSKVHECIYCSYKTTSKNMFTRHMLKHPDFCTEVSSKST